jgi:hypothetical protein
MTEPVSLTGLPQALANALGISLFPAQILATCLFIALIDVPLLWVTKGRNINLIMISTFLMLGFSVAMGWIGIWIFLIICLFIGIGLADIARKWLTGHI